MQKGWAYFCETAVHVVRFGQYDPSHPPPPQNTHTPLELEPCTKAIEFAKEQDDEDLWEILYNSPSFYNQPEPPAVDPDDKLNPYRTNMYALCHI